MKKVLVLTAVAFFFMPSIRFVEGLPENTLTAIISRSGEEPKSRKMELHIPNPIELYPVFQRIDKSVM
jgi:hypothetical protein